MKHSARKHPPRPAPKTAPLSEFGREQDQRPMMAELYREAKARLQQSPQESPPGPGVGKSAGDTRLLHELQVHQVELELQNAELQEGRERMETLLEKVTDLYDFAPVGYLSLNDDGVIIEANLTSAAMLGVGRSRLLNQRLPVFLTPASRPGVAAFLNHVLSGLTNLTCETLLAREDGTTLAVSLRATSAVSVLSGRQWCRLALVDISERLAVESALRESEKRYRTLFDLVPIGVYSCDAAGLVQNFNRRAVELWGRTPVTGAASERYCGAFKMLRPDGSVLPRELCPMADVLLGKIPSVLDAEVVLQQPGGDKLAVTVNIRPLKTEHGEIIGAINCFYDITERKRAEAALHQVAVLAASHQKLEMEIAQRRAVEASLRQGEQHQRQVLAQSNLMQAQLRHFSRQVIQAQEDERKQISRELHDVIAQTLTGINLRLASIKLQAGRSTRGFEQNLAQTQRLVEKSVDIVHRFARELRPAVLDDLGLIPALHAYLKSFTARTGVHAHLKVFAGLDQLATAQRTVLFRVAQEALTNVGRHARATQVEVNLRKRRSGVTMEIKDDGKSFRVESTLPANGGKRLGLLGMRERVEMIGGTFAVASAPGQGTSIRVELPAHPVPKKTPKKSAQSVLP